MPADKKDHTYLSIIIPAYNEEYRLPKTLEHIANFCDANPFKTEIIVVDDGSTDDTLKVIEEAKRNERSIKIVKLKHRGKGHAVKHGMLEANGDYMLLSDADLSVPIDDVHYLLNSKPRPDIAIGSREVEGSQRIGEPPYRHIMGRTFNGLVKVLTGLKFQDTQCGFKLFRKSSTQEIFNQQKTNGFGFDVELLFLAERKRLTINEVPVTWVYGEESRVKPLQHSLEMIKDAIMIRWRYWVGAYK
ncbi:MAG: glycosyltransferase family 2 protein [SAR202 cluster bacterium]|nr:glycosyltransferase family 2 protein [SAR202 cluster bacterium]|tara:strand:- start:719 stop:1453 length:735 start_codon:yes stop_codon:yes gene_type:complete